MRRHHPSSHAHSSGDGRLVTLWGPTGAPGVSTVASALAGALAQMDGTPGRVALVDANWQRGALDILLGPGQGESPAENIVAACRFTPPAHSPCAPLQDHADGFHLLPGVPGPTAPQPVDAEELAALLERLRAAYAWVIVDTGWALPDHEYGALHWAALAAADLVVVVAGATRLGVADLLQQYPALAMQLMTLGNAAPDIWCVLNRGHGTHTVTWQKRIEGDLCLPVVAYVPWDSAVAESEARYRPVTCARPRSKASRTLWTVAERVPRLQDAPPRQFRDKSATIPRPHAAMIEAGTPPACE